MLQPFSSRNCTSCAVLNNGSVKCWGRVLGSNQSADYPSPTTAW